MDNFYFEQKYLILETSGSTNPNQAPNLDDILKLTLCAL